MQLLLCFLLFSLWHASDAQKSILNCQDFKCERDKFLLFTIKANIGKSAIAEFENKATPGDAAGFPQPEGTNMIPDLFRSSFLDNLAEAVQRTGAKYIVSEMRKAGSVVASATFDVASNTVQLNSNNWFQSNRLVRTYPYWKGSSAANYVDMTIKGHRINRYQRSFYIHHSHGLCETDTGLMGIGETNNDGCSWVSQGGNPPILFYTKKEGTYRGKQFTVDYADRFLVYLTR